MDKPTNPDSLPNLIGRNFVKEFRDYLLSLIRNNKYDMKDLTKKAFMDKNIKPQTTERYLKEMEDMEIVGKYKLKVGEKEVYFIVGENNDEPN